MRLKQAAAIFGSLILVAVLFIAYSAKRLAIYSSTKSSTSQDIQENKWLHFEDNLKQLGEKLIQNVEKKSKVLNDKQSQINSVHNVVPLNPFITQVVKSDLIYNEKTCAFQTNPGPQSDIQMLELYEKLNFDNIDGGVWKQGWKIEVDEKEWNRYNKLKVFVVPHSHNDPGWIKTVENYYSTQTKHILDNMLNKLGNDPRRKFIWAEISYFSMWWNDIDDDSREKVKQFIRNNQLEFVTGGWVMNDEANSHWISIMNQLAEGHMWLQENLNYTPVSHWSIDPFGLGLTQPFLIKKMGLENMLIQRVHYSVKKHLARNQQLEFRWKQFWDGSGGSEIFTQLMPFYSYDIPHTCGPDPKICCQFDFKRLPNYGLHCPWRVPPQVITDRNIAERAELLLDQYRKKSKLFKSNVLLVPLGDDFRYDHPTEWDVQFQNYQKLFDYMNSNLKLNVQAQFGTLTDYFKELHKSKKISEFPTLTGDFFTYADRDDHYWSGYYTSRPFYKRMDRILLFYIRAAESIQTLAHFNSGNPDSSWITDKKDGLGKLIASARQAHSLFQHHDGITGTAKDHVVVDYGQKMLFAIKDCQNVIQICTNVLLKGPYSNMPTKTTIFYNIDDIRNQENVISEHFQITIGVPEIRSKKVVIYNSLSFTRKEVVTFHISTPFIEVIDFEGKRVLCQISPIFEYSSSMSQSKYQLSFVAVVPGLSLREYTINALLENETPSETVIAEVMILNYYGPVKTPVGLKPKVSNTPTEFTLENSKISAAFNKLGLLKAITIGKKTIPVHLDFAKYGVRRKGNTERSGAYLFLPDGDAIKIPVENIAVNIFKGPIMSSVFLQLPYVQHSVTIYNSTGADSLGLEIQNLVDISQTNNFELIMKLSTNINNTNQFYTDANGYQIIKRKTLKKLPLQANYYPMPTMSFIEDNSLRLTMTTSSPLGCSSLNPGQLEIMLDRRLNQDDNLGLGQGVMDNLPTKHIFRLILEEKKNGCENTGRNPDGYPTLAAHVTSQSLLNPLIRLLRVDDEDELSNTHFTSIHQFGVDLTFPVFKPNINVKNKSFVGLVIHRDYLNTCFGEPWLFEEFPLSDGLIDLSSLSTVYNVKEAYRTSLSFLFIRNQINIQDKLEICPMEIEAFLLKS